MPKYPVKIGNKTIEVQEFTDGGDRVFLVDDHFYRVWKVPGDQSPEKFYTMVKVGKHPRSIQGTHEKLVEMLVQIHMVYRDYQNQVRRSKEGAQLQRDRALNKIAEAQ